MVMVLGEITTAAHIDYQKVCVVCALTLIVGTFARQRAR
jgi:hypothetical protein